MLFVYAPALRPSLPAICRKRMLCQGQALSGRCAGLDFRIGASGIKCTRATDGDASGWGSVKGYIHFRCKKAKGIKHIHTDASDSAKIYTAQNQNAANAADGCLRSIAAMPISCWQFSCPMLAAYRQNAMLIYAANLPDAAISHISFRKHAFPFVQANLRRPAYVSSIRYAYSLTAGEGLCPFEPYYSREIMMRKRSLA